MEEQWISVKSIDLFKKLLKNDVTVLSHYYSISIFVCSFLVSLWKLEIETSFIKTTRESC